MRYLIKYIIIFVFLLNTSLFAQSPYSWVKSVHTTIGVPFDGDTTDDYIIVRDQYVLSYNKFKGGPNWVAWELNREWMGDVDRYKGKFITDKSLPDEFYKVTHDDYTNSGFDRGHMCMSKNRSKNEEDNKSTFIMSGILPQTPDLNRGVWLNFEKFCNILVIKEDKELFIYAGGIYHSGSTIGKGKVEVPDSCFKIVYVFNKKDKPYTKAKAEIVYMIIMPNIEGILNDDWQKYEKDVFRSIKYRMK